MPLFHSELLFSPLLFHLFLFCAVYFFFFSFFAIFLIIDYASMAHCRAAFMPRATPPPPLRHAITPR